MKKIDDYRNLLEVSKTASLQELKSAYRNAMKAWHPDKIQDDEAKKAEAESMSKLLIEAYHFLVSISPETKELELEDYNRTLSTSSIKDFSHDKGVLKVEFTDGSVWEYLSVPKPIYQKIVNSDSASRMAKRHVFPNYVYRNVRKSAMVPENA